jgi:hypothetical protein
MLQVGGPHIPWKMISMPAAARIEITGWPGADETVQELAVTVATGSNQVEALLGYLTIGALSHAGLVEQEAETSLSGAGDSAAGVARGYYLLRVSDLERLQAWSVSRANGLPWMPDVAVIEAWALLREQQETPSAPFALFFRARSRLLEAVERGVPVYTEGLRLLASGLRLIDLATDGQDREIRDAIDRIRPYLQAADLGQPTTSYTGSGPLSPSVTPAYGLPGQDNDLTFIWRRDMAARVTAAFLGRLLEKADGQSKVSVPRKVIVQVTCDIPHEGEVEATETISFAFDGKEYEIDLCPKHAVEFREIPGEYIGDSLPVSHRARRHHSSLTSSKNERSKESTEWVVVVKARTKE